MSARRFDPARNRQEIALLYGAEHEAHQPDWTAIIRLAQERSPDLRDVRDPREVKPEVRQ